MGVIFTKKVWKSYEVSLSRDSLVHLPQRRREISESGNGFQQGRHSRPSSSGLEAVAVALKESRQWPADGVGRQNEAAWRSQV